MERSALGAIVAVRAIVNNVNEIVDYKLIEDGSRKRIVKKYFNVIDSKIYCVRY